MQSVEAGPQGGQESSGTPLRSWNDGCLLANSNAQTTFASFLATEDLVENLILTMIWPSKDRWSEDLRRPQRAAAKIVATRIDQNHRRYSTSEENLQIQNHRRYSTSEENLQIRRNQRETSAS